MESGPRGSAKPSGRHWEELSTDSIQARTLDLAMQVYEQGLWQDARAQGYVRRRAVPEEVARTQRLGYADGHALLGRLRRESGAELLQVAVELGLVLERPRAEDGTSAYREFSRTDSSSLTCGRAVPSGGSGVRSRTKRDHRSSTSRVGHRGPPRNLQRQAARGPRSADRGRSTCARRAKSR